MKCVFSKKCLCLGGYFKISLVKFYGQINSSGQIQVNLPIGKYPASSISILYILFLHTKNLFMYCSILKIIITLFIVMHYGSHINNAHNRELYCMYYSCLCHQVVDKLVGLSLIRPYDMNDHAIIFLFYEKIVLLLIFYQLFFNVKRAVIVISQYV